MAEESTIKKSWDMLMGAKTEDAAPQGGGGTRFLFALVLLVGITISGWSIYQQFNAAPHVPPGERRLTAEPDKQRLDKMISDLKSAIATRESSAGVVDSAFAVHRYPFGAPAVAVVPQDDSTVVVPELVAVEIDLDNVISPPGVNVKGVMAVGSSVVALLDIDGEPRGQIYRVGDTFQGKDGRIVRIEKNKVTVRYKGKNFGFSH